MSRSRANAWRPLARLLPAAAALLATALAAASAGGRRPAQFELVIAQTASVIWLAQIGWSRARGWATATVLVAAAWVPTFLISSWIYAIDPTLLDVGSATPALAICELSILAMIAGFGLWPRRPLRDCAPTVELLGARARGRTIVAWSLVGFLSLAFVIGTGGGPIHYIRNINHEGSLAQGKTYFIILALAMLFCAQLAICVRWARGQTIDRASLAALVVGLGLIAILGARIFLAETLAQLAIFYGLCRPRPSLRLLLPVVVIVAAGLILGVGAVKRYSDYQAQHPGTHIGLLTYARTIAPREIPTAYADNYADGVRLMALSRKTVPAQADYEYGKELLRLLLQPLPHSIRPSVQPAPALKAALYPGGGYLYAQPLQVVSYLQFGYAGVAIAFVLLGVALAELDRYLTHPRRLRPGSLVLFTMLIVQVLATLRGAAAPSDAVAISIMVVIWLVVRTVEQLDSTGAETVASPSPSGESVGAATSALS